MSKPPKVALNIRISRLEQELENRKQEAIIYKDRVESLEETIKGLEKIIINENKQAIHEKKEKTKGFTTNLNYKNRILTLLKSESLTSNELAEKLFLSKQDTRTYLLRLKKDDKIKPIGKKGRFFVYTYTEPQDSETQYTLLHALEYDIGYILNLLEMKMTLKNGKELSPTDVIIINRLRNRISDKMENVRKETEVLNEYINEQGFRSKTNKKIAELEAKINFIESQKTEEFVESWKEEEVKVGFTELLQKVDNQQDSTEIIYFLDKVRKAPIEEKLNAFCFIFEKIMQILLKSADLVDNGFYGINSMVSTLQNQLTIINSDITSLKSRQVPGAEL